MAKINVGLHPGVAVFQECSTGRSVRYNRAMNVVCLVASPLQLINVYEARQRYDIVSKDAHLIVLAQTGGRNRTTSQIKHLLRRQTWGRVSFVSLPHHQAGPVEYFRMYSRMLKRLRFLAAQSPQQPAMFLGDYNDLFLRFAGMRAWAEIVLVDDGMKTIEVARRRAGHSEVPLMHRRGQSLSSAVKTLFFRSPVHVPAEVTFFTCYDIDVSSNDRMIYNDYRELRSAAGAPIPIDTTWFVGQPLVEDRLIQESLYIQLVSRIVSKYKGKVQYIPHRRESTRKLDLIKDLGVDIQVLDVPLEVYILESGLAPRAIVSVCSSALITLGGIIGDNSEIIALRIASTAFSYRAEHIENIYEYLDIAGYVRIEDV